MKNPMSPERRRKMRGLVGIGEGIHSPIKRKFTRRITGKAIQSLM
jgi:hypothetical protein